MIAKFICLSSRVLLENQLHLNCALRHAFTMLTIGCQPISHRPQPRLESILVCSDVIYSSNSAKNIGAWFDTVMSMDKQINSICQSAFYHLRNIAQISRHISFRDCETLIHASKIGHYNILLSGLKQDQVRKLQYVQNSADRLLTGTRKHEHITPVLRDLHWLPVHERICFKN